MLDKVGVLARCNQPQIKKPLARLMSNTYDVIFIGMILMHLLELANGLPYLARTSPP